jgi:hypothetical protein
LNGPRFAAASMAKAKREEKASKKDDEGYEFKLPDFDEKAFIRREVESAKASFWTLGIGAAAGIAAYLLLVAGLDWRLGWLPILASLAFLRPLLQKVGFSEESTQPKALLGSYFMLFFTALALWILGVNLVGL